MRNYWEEIKNEIVGISGCLLKVAGGLVVFGVLAWFSSEYRLISEDELHSMCYEAYTGHDAQLDDAQAKVDKCRDLIENAIDTEEYDYYLDEALDVISSINLSH